MFEHRKPWLIPIMIIEPWLWISSVLKTAEDQDEESVLQTGIIIIILSKCFRSRLTDDFPSLALDALFKCSSFFILPDHDCVFSQKQQRIGCKTRIGTSQKYYLAKKNFLALAKPDPLTKIVLLAHGIKQWHFQWPNTSEPVPQAVVVGIKPEIPRLESNALPLHNFTPIVHGGQLYKYMKSMRNTSSIFTQKHE